MSKWKDRMEQMEDDGLYPEPPPVKPGDRLKKSGGVMIGLCVACMFIGRSVVANFFPEMVGAGLTPQTLLILIPTWSLGLIGLILVLVGWLSGRVR